MERKLILQGKQAYTVALPISWIRKHDLSPKDAVQIVEEGDKLVVSSKLKAKSESIEVNVSGNTRLEAMLKIESKYIQGYDEIRINHDNLPLIREISQGLMGMVIEDYKKDYCVLKSIVNSADDNIRNIIMKTVFILEEQAKTLVQLAEGKIKLETSLAEESLMDYNNLYAVRFLNKYKQDAEGHALFLICSSFDIVSDLMGEIAKKIKKDVKLAKSVEYYIINYVKLLQKNDFKGLNKLLLDESKHGQKTFLEGILYSITEILYNYLAYIVEIFNKK
ncbi:AbrB/MazE/SpoVT family DNA-binding domain-containing protein [Candidatus Pacearchaeota archaeon]|nr:AbrB/MazE/SpoVT family DNA-binding domain-containing protein [Candidatus Pacearchaeota archaeon]